MSRGKYLTVLPLETLHTSTRWAAGNTVGCCGRRRDNHMMQNVLSIIYSLINVWGTVWAILSILKLKPGNVYKSLTVGALLEADESLLVQREQARFGITLVVIAFAFQSVSSFVSVDTVGEFLGWLILTVVVLAVACLIIHHMNISFRKEYTAFKEIKEKEGKNG